MSQPPTDPAEPRRRLARWWERVNRRFEPTYGVETPQDRKDDMTPTPGYHRGTGSGRHEAERYEGDSGRE